jgi:RNA methyltransferase, TrmH family
MKVNTICGRNAVAALFARRPGDVLRLFHLPEMKQEAGPFCARLAQSRLPYRMVGEEELAKVAGTAHHGGIVAVAKPRIPAILDPRAPPRVPLLLVLDGIGNPHNLGAIARSAAYFGVAALLLTERHGDALPSDAAFRTAEGGLEWLDLYRTRDLTGAVTAMLPVYRPLAATLSPGALAPAEVPRDRPIMLILGNEETGVSAPVLEVVRRHVRVPGSGRVQSLNVAQAAAVLLHALS